MKVLVTGAAGFIGSKLSFSLAERGDEVIALDNLDDNYDTRIKLERIRLCGIESDKGRFIDSSIKRSGIFPNYTFIRMDLADRGQITQLFQNEQFDAVINLAGQSGLSNSMTNPYSCIDSNLVGFMNILENCRQNGVGHLIYASSSSVYGTNDSSPSNEDIRTDCPMSLNAATKKANEMMAHSYSELYGLPTTGLRLFTVYGPWSRPDTTSMIFATAVSNGEPCRIYGDENASRDFIYIDDAVDAIIRVLDHKPACNFPQEIPFRIFNVGSSVSTKLTDFIASLEQAFGKTVPKEHLPAKRGNMLGACADMSRLESEFGFRPKTSLTEGISRFVEWYNSDVNPLK